VFLTFEEKKVGNKSSGMAVKGINLESRNDENRNAPEYFTRHREEKAVRLADALTELLQRLKSLNNERTNLVAEIERLSEEARRETAEQEKELSTLKEQVRALEEVLREMHSRRRI
jgi:predicted  nucleic acid-binding Zn-ribbon protein